MASVSLYNSIFTEKVGPPQRHSSSAFIADLLLQEYPPKVQPRSSSTRDHSLYDTLDKVDAEASCILIALANHDKKKDMNDLIPYSIRVIDYNQLSEEPPISAESSVSGSSSCTDGNTDHNNNNCNNSNNSNNSNNKNMNDEISHQDIPKSLDEANDNRSMSIKNLLGMNSSNDIPASSTSETPSMYGDTNKPLKIQLTSNKSNIPLPRQQKDEEEEQINDRPKESSWKRKPQSDPILLLAEAAKALDRDEQLQNQLTQKRKYSGDDNLNHRSIRPRHPMRDDQILQNEKSKFSYQYLSMKQNPKIKRNAMHAYITYMIYTDLASSDKSYYSQTEKSTHHQPNGSVFLPPSSSSQLSTPTSQHEFNSLSSYPPPPPPSSSSHHQHHYQHQQNNNNLEHSNEPYSRGKGYPSSTTTTPTVAAAIATAAPTPPDNWHYGLSNSTPSPSLQHRRDIKLENNGNGNSNNNSSIMMARPLTAFLRDDLYT